MVVTPFRSIVGDEPDTLNEPTTLVGPTTFKLPVIPAEPVKGNVVADTPVNPLPSPTYEPENIEPDIAAALVKLTTTDEPETVREPVITALPLKGNAEVFTPVKLDPSP